MMISTTLLSGALLSLYILCEVTQRNALWGFVVFMECYKDFRHKHNNVQGPYIIMLLLHSTHEYAQ